MTRLDRHVRAVQNRMTISLLLGYLGWSMLAFAIAVGVNVLADRFLAWRLPRWDLWLLVGFGAAVVGAITVALLKRPTQRDAATAIDERLELKERFSTALYVRPTADPFAAAN